MIWRAEDLHFAAGLAREPDPSGTELLDTGVVELGLEILEVAEGLGDRVADGAGGIASASGFHDLPEHGVVDVASSIVADGCPDVLRDRIEVANQIFRGFLTKLGMLFQGGVEVLHISAVVHVVVQGHRLLVDDGFECRIVIRQGG